MKGSWQIANDTILISDELIKFYAGPVGLVFVQVCQSQGADRLSCEISVTNPNRFNENSIYGKTGLDVEVMFPVNHKPS